MTRMPSSDVRVEVIVNGLKELQQEKSRLEQKLGDLRRQKNVVERNVEVLTNRRSQIGDVNAKLKETLQVAQNKVGQTQAQIDTLQKQLCIKREQNQRLTKDAEDCKKSLLEITRAFEQDLVKLTGMFSDAKKYYQEQNLTHEMAASENSTSAMKSNTAELQRETAELSQTFERMTLEAKMEEEKLAKMFVSPSEQKQVFELLESENDSAKSTLREVMQRKAKLNEELKQLESMV